MDKGEIKEKLPEDLKELSDLPNENVNPANMPISQLKTLDRSQLDQLRSSPTQTQANPRETIAIDTQTLFGMFEVKDTQVNLKVEVPLPAKNLLKMMYVNSQDKDKFIEQLAAHINNSITLDAIKASVNTMMGHDKKKSTDGE